MIAHVAAAGEQRGRVVLHLTAGRANRIALEAAIRVAKAFESELESLFVEDQGLYECANFPFACEISLHGRERRPLSTVGVEKQLRYMATALGRELSELARLADVPLRQTVVRDDPISALAKACAERGPWNVIALGEPIGSTAGEMIRRLFETVLDTTAVIVTGPRARRSKGPVIVVVEDIAHLESMLRAAERLLADAPDRSVVVLLVADTEEKASWMEGQVRLVLGPKSNAVVSHVVVTEGGEAKLAEALRRMRGSFVIGQYGGILVPPSGNLRHLLSSLECPLFLVR